MRRWDRGAAAALAVALTAGCGTQLDHDEIVAAATRTRTVVIEGGPAGRAGPATDLRTVPHSGAPLAESPVGGPSAPAVAATPDAGSGPGPTPGAGLPAANSSPAEPGGSVAAPPAANGGNAATGETGARAGGAGRATIPAPPAGAKSEVAIASVGPYSGVIGGTVGKYVEGLRMWVAAANARGGLNGHPVRLIVSDDRADSSRHRSLVQQLVEQDKVIAFVQNVLSVAGRGSIDYIQSKRVPVIGSEDGAGWVYDHSMYFAPRPSGPLHAYAVLAGIGELAVPAGKTKLAVLSCAELEDPCATFDRAWTEAAPEIGFEVVYRARPGLTQPDYTAECLSAIRSGAQVIVIAMDNNGNRRVAGSCRRQGYAGLIGLPSQTVVPEFAGDANLDGAVIGTQMVPWVAALPALEEFRAAAARFAPGVAPSGAQLIGWISGRVLGAATRALPEPATPGAVLDGLWSIRQDDLGGLTYHLTFERDRTSPKKICWGVVQIQGGKFVAPRGPELKCR